MLLVLPVSRVDLGMAIEMAKWAKKLGPYDRHKALIVWDPAIVFEQRVRFRRLVDQWGFAFVTELEPTLRADEVGWPAGPNGMFRHTVSHIQRTADLRGPWYFFEADNVPMVAGWLDKIEAEYNRTRMRFPCMGVLENSWMEARSGGLIHRIPVGKHLVGTAVYPWDLVRLTMSFMHTGNRAFDVVMQDDLVPEYARHTDLIQHNWLTCNYRWENGVIKCDAADGKIEGQKGYALNHDVRKNAVVVHGCKDGSLLRVLQAEHELALQAEREKVVAFVEQPVEPAPVVNPPARKPRRRKQPAAC